MTNRRDVLKSALAFGAAAPITVAGPGVAKRQPTQSVPQPFPPSFNPLSGNPLKSRDDLVTALRSLYLPLLPHYSPGGARVHLDAAGTIFDYAAVDLEGFARPLWGLAPLAFGGGADFVDWALLRRGLANGTNPDHPEYWGDPVDGEQRLVELAAIGFALALVPEKLWRPQSPAAQRVIAAYLQKAYPLRFGSGNWMFFRLLIAAGLTRIGQPFDCSLIHAFEKRIDALYLGDGWYRDGPSRRSDHYVGFAFHFYGLVLSKLSNDANRARLYQQRAAAFAPEFVRWFADDGASIPFGRSLTYRFACAGFFAALAFADAPVIGWGQLKGVILRHLRWWARQPMCHRDGVMSIGFSYPNLHVSEHYNSAGSPYWAFKLFTVLALPASHSFWTAKEEPLQVSPEPAVLKSPGMILFNNPGDVVALTCGQEENARWMRLASEKYSKFAYSSRYGFSVDTHASQFDAASFDSMLAFSGDKQHFHIRESFGSAKIGPGLSHSRWAPTEHIDVETWLIPAPPWHVRVHRIVARRPYHCIEGGFAIARPDGLTVGDVRLDDGTAAVHTPNDFATIIDLGSSVRRVGRVLDALPNTNIINSRTSVPQLTAKIPAGESLLACAVLATPELGKVDDWTARAPVAPSLSWLRAKTERELTNVSLLNFDDWKPV